METWTRDLDLRALQREFGTPLYVVNLEQLEHNLAAYVGAVGHPGRVLYPVKTNPSLHVLRHLAGLGAGADCASGTEVQLARYAGVPPERIAYNTPAPDLRLARKLLEQGSTVVVDSARVLRELDRAPAPAPHPGRILVRVNPSLDAGYAAPEPWHELTAHGGETTKFGIPAEEILPLLSETRCAVAGLHLHVGTQMDNIAAFERGLDLLHRLRDELQARTHHRLAVLDLGGGLGIPFTEGQELPSIADLGRALARKARPGLEVLVEPGASLIGDAVGLLTTLVALKPMRGKRWGIVDVGSDQLAKVTLLHWPHQILGPTHRALPLRGPDSLGGPLCFAGDTLLTATELQDLAEGDPLLVQHCGAYLHALRNPFNGRLDPRQLLVRGGDILGLGQEAEDAFYGPDILGLSGATARRTSPSPRAPLDGRRVERLSSVYLRELASQDRYRFVSAARTGELEWDFEMEASAAVSFVSAPLALRMVGDAGIVAICDRLGREGKDMDVWGTRLAMSFADVLPPGALRCRIQLSALAPGAQGRQTVLVSFDLAGRLRGTLQVKFTA